VHQKHGTRRNLTPRWKSINITGVVCWGTQTVMYNVLSGLAACGRLGVAARPACLFVTRSGTRPVARDQRHASHVGATPAD